MTALVYVEPHEAPNIWPKIEHYLQQANNYGGGKYTMHHWLARILLGEVDLFVDPELQLAVVCEPAQYPLKRTYTIALVGGEGGYPWADGHELIEQAAKVRGCQTLEVNGRPGWKPILKDMNYELAHYVWRKELN